MTKQNAMPLQRSLVFSIACICRPFLMSLQSETILGYLFAFPKGLGVAMAAGVFISTRGGAGPMFNPLAGTGWNGGQSPVPR